jgi:HEAT repeat protein
VCIPHPSYRCLRDEYSGNPLQDFTTRATAYNREPQKPADINRSLERIKGRTAAERREAIEQLAESEDPRAVDAVIAALKDQEGEFRASAANALGQLGDKRARCTIDLDAQR